LFTLTLNEGCVGQHNLYNDLIEGDSRVDLSAFRVHSISIVSAVKRKIETEDTADNVKKVRTESPAPTMSASSSTNSLGGG